MTKLLAVALTACLALAVAAAPASAKNRTCKTGSPYEAIETVDVKCKRAKKVVKRFFKDNTATPFGFTCKQKQYPGGVTTTCRKDDRRIVHMSAD